MMFDDTSHSVYERRATKFGILLNETQFFLIEMFRTAGVIYLQGKRVGRYALPAGVDYVGELSTEVADGTIHVCHVREDFYS